MWLCEFSLPGNFRPSAWYNLGRAAVRVPFQRTTRERSRSNPRRLLVPDGCGLLS
jgi:hypothetical protein